MSKFYYGTNNSQYSPKTCFVSYKLYVTLQVQATDNGVPSQSSTAQVYVRVTAMMNNSKHTPSVKLKNHIVKVSEDKPVGFLIAQIQATDEGSEDLWFKITGKVEFIRIL